MQHLHQTIKRDVIKHATRDIGIIYEPGKAVKTAQDEQLLAAYIKLHDFELKMQSTADKLYKESIPLNKAIEALREELILVQATFDTCCELADKLSDVTYSVKETSLEKLTESQEKTSKEIADYNERICKIYEITEALSKGVTEYNLANEDEMNLLYDEFSAINTAHSVKWENNAINIAEFDDEYQHFLSFRNVKEDHRTTLMNLCENTIVNYSNLNLQTTTLYNVWKEFLKRCSLLRAMADLHANALTININ